MSITDKQLQTLKIIGEGHEPGAELIDFDTLLERLAWKPSKASAHFMIRSMVDKGFIAKGSLVKRRGARRRLFELTPGGVFELKNQPGVSLESESELANEPLSLTDFEDIVPQEIVTFGDGA